MMFFKSFKEIFAILEEFTKNRYRQFIYSEEII